MSESSNTSDCGFYHTLNDPSNQGELRNPVGFDQYQEQVVNVLVQRDFKFNILCIGDTGVGKSSFLNTLFEKEILETGNQSMDPGSVSLKTITKVLKESNTTVKFNITETVGYGDTYERVEDDQQLISFINEKYTSYLNEEMKIRRRRSNLQDERIHICFFFVAPSYQSVKALDVAFLKELCTLVNVIPVISKCDVLTKAELARFKIAVMEKLKANDIDYYKFPTDDRFSQEKNEIANSKMPFAIINANEVSSDGKLLGVRNYPWGSLKVDDDEITDFSAIRDIIKLNMNDLIVKTERVHYERFRLNYIKFHGYDPIDIGIVARGSRNKRTTKEGLSASYRVMMDDLKNEHEKKKAQLEDRYRIMMEEIRTGANKEKPTSMTAPVAGDKAAPEARSSEKAEDKPEVAAEEKVEDRASATASSKKSSKVDPVQ